MSSVGPQSNFSEKLHADKYRARGESYEEASTRIANVLTDDEESFKELRQIIREMRFLFGGRIQSSVGSLRATTPYNCFVSGTISDSFIDGGGSIMTRATEAATTMRMGGGIGYDFSTLRPRGALIKKLASNSSGPVSFMEIFDAVCRAVASSGHRRGAQMGVLRIDHPDIEEFIRAKQNIHRLTGFNISVAVTDTFMQAVVNDDEFPLRFQDQVYRTVHARSLWDTLMRSTYDWAEPGVLFIDQINRMNNLYYCETIAATNPCGEQPLPPYGACLLGSFNLTKYLLRGLKGWEFNYSQFIEDIPVVVDAMDHVVDAANYPLQEQETEAFNKRRMGIGVTGVANTVEALGFPYGSDGFVNVLSSILSTLKNEAYRASANLAKKKGSFPLYNKDKYLNGEFIQTLPDDVLDTIEANGMRNSHLISIAPTGTISMTADNVSSGIEPVFAHHVTRTVIGAEGPTTYDITDYGVKYLDVKGKTINEVTLNEHLKVLVAAQQYVDSAVSKTCNVPVDCSWDDFKNIYIAAWRNGAKGCTTYRMGGKREGILQPKAEEETSACGFDPESGRRNCE